MTAKFKERFWLSSLTLWLTFSSLAVVLVAFSLWWKRDRILYSDTSPGVQRVEVFSRAGLKPDALMLANEFAANEAIDYQAGYLLRGDYNTSSYIKYLLAPRVPDGSPQVYLNIDEKPAREIDARQLVFAFDETTPLAKAGWFFSALIIWGCGCLMARALGVNDGLPAIIGLGVLANGMIVMILRSLGGGMSGAGIVMSLLALSGMWLCRQEIIRRIKEIQKSPRSLIDLGLLLLAIGSVWLAWRMATIVVPDDWDAWAIWGAKAKVLALGMGSLSDVTHFGHADYPLMWPAVWALSGWCSGGWEEQLARGWSAIFFGLTGWQLAKTGRFCGASGRQSLFVAPFFLSIPKAIVVASWSYAESLLWLFMALSFDRAIRFARQQVAKDAWLAVLFAIGASYTKNEGLLFLAMMLGLQFIHTPQGARLGVALKSAAMVAALYGPWAVWTRFALDLDSHATTGLTIARMNEILLRIPQGWQHALAVWLDFQQWSVALILLLAGIFWSLTRSRGRDLLLMTFPILYLAGLFLVVVGHTAEIGWQVGTAWDRLTLQAVPLFMTGIMHSNLKTNNTI